jgi:hypothetical protein
VGDCWGVVFGVISCWHLTLLLTYISLVAGEIFVIVSIMILSVTIQFFSFGVGELHVGHLPS